MKWIKKNKHRDIKNGEISSTSKKQAGTFSPFTIKQPPALGRKNWLFSASPSGAKAGAIFFSLIETCKANDVEPYHYFCVMLNRIRECVTEDDYPKLLPQFIQI